MIKCLCVYNHSEDIYILSLIAVCLLGALKWY